jgi:hypothetical protein
MNCYEYAAAPYFFFDHASAGDQYKKTSVILPFALLRAVNPQDTLLDARRLSSMILEVNFGNPAGLAEITSVDAGYVKINTGEYSNVGQDAQFARKEYGWDTIDFTSAGTLQHRLEVQSNNQYRRLWIFTWDDSTPTARVNDAISNIKLRSRSFHFVDYENDYLQWRNLLEFNQVNPASVTYDPVAADSYNSSPITGLYVLDAPDYGLMSQRIDARELSELVLEVETENGTDSMEVIKEKAIFA